MERSYSLRHSCFRTLHQDSGGEVFNGLGNLQMSPRLSGKNEGPAQWFSGESTSSGIAADMHTSHGAPHILQRGRLTLSHLHHFPDGETAPER